MKILSKQVQDLSDRKLELEERIEVIEKDKMIMEKQVKTQDNWNQYEEIKFDTEEDETPFTEETEIEIKMEIPSAPENESENIDFNEEPTVEENHDEEEDIEKIREHNKNVVFCWYTKCAEVGMIPKEFETIPETEDKVIIPRTTNDDEINLCKEEDIDDVIEPEDENIQEKLIKETELKEENKLELDESVFDNEIKIEDK